MEDVVALAKRAFVLIEPKSAREASLFFGDEIVSIRREILDVLAELCIEEWRFRQVRHGEWADIYRVGVFDDWPDAWIKIKIERPNGYHAVAVISFHEWDDARAT